MKLTYQVEDRPKLGQTLIFSLQQLLAIMTATLVVPIIINNNVPGCALTPAAALFGAGIGTFVYLLFTKFRSPVFLGSSFAFIGSMTTAAAGAASMALGYLGLILGAVFAGGVYALIALAVKFAGVNWLHKLMPSVVIGPTVTIIGLSLAGNAVGDLMKGSVTSPQVVQEIADGKIVDKLVQTPVASPLIAILCGVIALFVTMLCSTYGKKMLKLIPFIIGILTGYAVAAIFTVIGNAAGADALKILDFSQISALWKEGVSLSTFVNKDIGFVFLKSIDGLKELNGSYILTVAVAYVPVAFVVFAEHIADHTNISSIIERDLLVNPGLSRTLLGDGIGSMAGAFFGACPNTTYGESVACVAISGNASIVSIVGAAALAIVVSFFAPFVAFVNSIPSCVMGGICMALYGFIAVSGLKMIRDVDLGENHNLFVVSTILIAGIGGLTLNFGDVTITPIAVALILGILANVILNHKREKSETMAKSGSKGKK